VTIHKEATFENEICAHLAANGWLYAEGDAAHYDRARALYPDDAIAWVESAYPKDWAALVKAHGAKAREVLLDRLRHQIDQQGTLDVLRQGIEMIGAKSKIRFAAFRPAFTINAELLAQYSANRLRVVRQVRYSLANENAIDLVLFLNGVPVATAELKSDFTQAVEDAVKQYQFDRNPRPKGQAVEPLLAFPSGALVHFAVSNSEVQMTTRLDGPSTVFLPFNKGRDGGKGNPDNPRGHTTAYLWEEVWQRDSWLEILGRYVIAPRNERKVIDKIIFPRYHQLDVTRKLQEAIAGDGVGGRYLVQHSAGSGKTNSIAWTAHFLAEMHDVNNTKVFDSVIVVSDRTVIDDQLQKALEAFEKQKGVVATITGKESSKSAALAEALSGDKKIVACTIQTFPFALEAVRALAATEGKRFAVIADEAHSSQSGEAASRLKEVLSADELKALEDGGEVSAEDLLALSLDSRLDSKLEAKMAARAESGSKGISFVAFTATPKNKTLELFGTRPDPTKPPADDNLPRPFHVYSMRQAIEEGFILDVLRNYTTYKMAFKLAHNGAEYDERAVERAQAMKGIMGWVRLHPFNISQKVEIVVEHFRERVAPLLEGKAKAMVVVASRVEAVRWQLAIEKYIAKKGYGIGTLVAFSGEVHDKESGPEPFSETSKELNPGLRGRTIRDAFDTKEDSKLNEYSILLVANKFQTGFDQPLLCGMYVDKRLAGIQAVQTLSRLNRAHKGKDTTYVLDFTNEAEDVLAAFKTYYDTAELSAATDPNIVFNLKAKLDGAGYYDDNEVERVVKAEMNPSAKQADLVAAITPVCQRLLTQFRDAQAAWRTATDAGQGAEAKKHRETMDALTLFKADMGQYLRVYVFLSQIFNYGNSDVEKRAIFYRRLLPLLEFGREREEIDLSSVRLTHYTLKNTGTTRPDLRAGESPKLDPITAAGTGSMQERVKARLSEIIERVNELFEGDLTDDDMLIYVNDTIVGKLLENETLQEQAANNEPARFGESPDLLDAVVEAVLSARIAHQKMSDQVLNDPKVLRGLIDVLVNFTDLHARLRAARKAG
jgi:type I restriction enzyme R subunit